ncbi:hypothetical protein Q3G72_004267 [Acer saccharum]|nr:hypothetical protein Q3G72_004267 [Acer saccharum]
MVCHSRTLVKATSHCSHAVHLFPVGRISKFLEADSGIGCCASRRWSWIRIYKQQQQQIRNNHWRWGCVEHVGGDMFQSIPKWILHCWDDDHCLRLLKNCYDAIPDDGKVIVLNAVISELPETSNAARETSLLDVLLLTRDSGGKERTKPEFIALA